MKRSTIVLLCSALMMLGLTCAWMAGTTAADESMAPAPHELESDRTDSTTNGEEEDMSAVKEKSESPRTGGGSTMPHARAYLIPRDASEWDVEFDEEDLRAGEKEPKPKVTGDGLELVEGTDYELSYSYDADTDTVYVTITGINKFEGEQQVSCHVSGQARDDGERSDTGGLVTDATADTAMARSSLAC